MKNVNNSKVKGLLRNVSVVKRTAHKRLVWIGMSVCATPLAWAQPKTVDQDGVSLTYDSGIFSKVEIIELKKQPLPDPHDRLNVHPANLLFVFYANAKYVGSIKLYPLEDRSEENLRAAYPELLPNTFALARLITDRPALPLRYPSGNPKEIPTIQNQMAEQYFLSHARYIDFSWGSGVGFLVQYSQDASEYAVGSRLDYQIEGISWDKSIAISANFEVAHPDLPPTKKDGTIRDKNGESIGEAAYMKYLAKMEKFLDEKNEASFNPPLDSIQRLVGSLQFKNVDSSGWGSKFDGKTTVIE